MSARQAEPSLKCPTGEDNAAGTVSSRYSVPLRGLLHVRRRLPFLLGAGGLAIGIHQPGFFYLSRLDSRRPVPETSPFLTFMRNAVSDVARDRRDPEHGSPSRHGAKAERAPWESRRAGYLPTPDWTALIMLCPGGVVPL
jgi:hypothetical protein